MIKWIDKAQIKLLMIDKSVILLFVFSVLGSIVNYAFQIVLGNMLAIAEYGDFNTINSLSSNLLCLYSPLAVYACRVSAEKQNNLRANSLIYRRMFVFVLIISFVILSVGGVFFPVVLQGGLGVKTFSFWMLILVMTVIAGAYAVVNGTLQGIGQLGWYGFLGFVLVVIKMGFSYAGVKLGGQVQAVVWAMIVSYVVVICGVFVVIGRTVNHQCRDGQIHRKLIISYKEILQLYGITFLVQMFFSPYINGGEIILMNYFYDNEVVGRYSLAANVVKISMYILSIFTSALLPKISLEWGKGKSIKTKFYASMAFAFVTGVVWVLFLSTFGKQVILLILGQRYYEALSGIKNMALWIIGLGMLMVVNTFYLAINRLTVYLVVLISVTAGIIGCVAFSGLEIVYVPIVIGVGIQVILLFALIDIRRIVNPNITKG